MSTAFSTFILRHFSSKINVTTGSHCELLEATVEKHTSICGRVKRARARLLNLLYTVAVLKSAPQWNLFRFKEWISFSILSLVYCATSILFAEAFLRVEDTLWKLLFSQKLPDSWIYWVWSLPWHVLSMERKFSRLLPDI